MFHLGFSYVGLIYLCMLYIPNIIWTKNKPADYEKEVVKENKFLLALERSGEVLVTVLALIFTDFNIDLDRCSSLPILALSFLFMICYELYWIRYFKSAKTLKDFYSPFLGIPVAGASYPVLAFFVLGLYGANAFMLLAVTILGIGHIGIHVQHQKSAVEEKRHCLPIRILKRFGAVIGIVLVIFFIAYFGIRNIRFIKAFAGAKNPVAEDCFVELNGQKQFIRVMGRNLNSPVVVFLHGGPTSPDGMMDYCFMDYLLDDYTYITWDQRGSGRTYYKNKKADPQNETADVEQLLSDLDSLVDYVCVRFGQEKVTLFGHSWGTILAVRYSLMHPEKIEKTICVGQVVSFLEGDKLAYENALLKAEKAGDKTEEMTKALETYLNTPSLFTISELRSFTGPYNKPEFPEKGFIYGALSPYLGLDDIRWMFLDNADLDKTYGKNSLLYDYVFSDEMKDGMKFYGTDFKVPMYFISGEMDWICPTALAKKYYEEITAPEKAFFEIEGCGHTPQGDKPKEAAEIIRGIEK